MPSSPNCSILTAVEGEAGKGGGDWSPELDVWRLYWELPDSPEGLEPGVAEELPVTWETARRAGWEGSYFPDRLVHRDGAGARGLGVKDGATSQPWPWPGSEQL